MLDLACAFYEQYVFPNPFVVTVQRHCGCDFCVCGIVASLNVQEAKKDK